MKKYFLFLCAFLLLIYYGNLSSQSLPWVNTSNQIPGDSTNCLSDVIVPNRWGGFISSTSNPEIYRGDFWTENWVVLQTPSPVSTFFILFYDFGFICCTDSNIYKTTDAGDSWTYFGSLGKPINDIDFGNDIYNLKGYVCTNNGIIGKIEDTSLVIINSGFSTDFKKISVPYNEKVWLVGDSSVYFYDGNTFTKQFTSEVKLNSVHFLGELNGWVVGDSGYIAITSDGGNSWLQKQNPDTLKRNLNDIYLVSYFGFAVGDDGLILQTTNSGETWSMDTEQLTTNNLVCVHINGGGSEWGPGLSIGDNKTVLSYPIVVSVDDNPKPVGTFYLHQNYPNPFNPSTKIEFRIADYVFVTLKVYDVLGNEVATLVNEEKSAGTYEVEFNSTLGVRELASGIYFYQLKAGKLIQTRKMILLK
jgi:photosystem II stability/assembly factor-like uncharacterized protein